MIHKINIKLSITIDGKEYSRVMPAEVDNYKLADYIEEMTRVMRSEIYHEAVKEGE